MKRNYRLEQFETAWVLTVDGTCEMWNVSNPLAAMYIVENNRDGEIVEVRTLNDKMEKAAG